MDHVDETIFLIYDKIVENQSIANNSAMHLESAKK